MNDPLEDDTRCNAQRRGRFDRLRCCLQRDHDGPCNFVVFGVRPCHDGPGPPRKQSDKDYERTRQRNQKRTQER